MKNAFWISLPVSLLCIYAQANTITVATTAPPTPAAMTTTGTAALPGASETSAVSTTVAKPEEKKDAPSVKYALALSAEYDLQAQTQPDGSRTQSMNYMLKPSLSYGEYTVRVEEYFAQDLQDTKGIGSNSWTDPAFSMSKKAWTVGLFKLAPGAGLVLPFKDSTRNEVGLLYSMSGSLGVSLDTKALAMDAWSFGYQILVGKTFTQFDTNAKSGNPSADHKFRNRLTFGYKFTDALSFFNLFDFTSAYTVNGVVTNSFFSLQSLGYDLTDNISISFSHTNGGPYLKGDTYENNLKLYSEEDSGYALGIELDI